MNSKKSLAISILSTIFLLSLSLFLVWINVSNKTTETSPSSIIQQQEKVIIDDGQIYDLEVFLQDPENPEVCEIMFTVVGCGDGIIQEGEVCDPGSGDGVVYSTVEACEDNTLGCTSDCECVVVEPDCGDGNIDDGEVCDLEAYESTTICNNNDNDCRSDCSCCGDGVVEHGEYCDDGNTDDDDDCRNDCTACGDGIVQDDEECDDGNDDDDDDCSNDCEENEPVECNDSCDDDSDCDGDLICYDGKCRNDACRLEEDCTCEEPEKPELPKAGGIQPSLIFTVGGIVLVVLGLLF